MTNQEALKSIKESYDAFFVLNKYGAGTHVEEFKQLKEHFKYDVMALRALNYIQHEYDCYYISEQDKNGPFYYLEGQLK